MFDAQLLILAAEAKRLGGLGLMACTAGNVSVRLEPGCIAMSPSGVDKGALTPPDFILMDNSGRALNDDPRKPSDETMLHLALYRAVSAACGAVCHGHPAHAVALSLATAGERLVFAGIEMQKAFAGTTSHHGELVLPIVDNSQDMAELSARVLANRDAAMPAVLVRGHGVYAWGRSVGEAGRHLEAVEWLSRVEAIRRTL